MNMKTIAVVSLLVVGIGFFLFFYKDSSTNYFSKAECESATQLPCMMMYVGDFNIEWYPSPYKSPEDCNKLTASSCFIPSGEFKEERWVLPDFYKDERVPY